MPIEDRKKPSRPKATQHKTMLRRAILTQRQDLEFITIGIFGDVERIWRSFKRKVEQKILEATTQFLANAMP